MDVKVASIIKYLNCTMNSDHFILHYCMRNRTNPSWVGIHGIRDVRMLHRYCEGLERLYCTLTGAPFSRQPPLTDKSGKTHVYILDSFSVFDRLVAYTIAEPSCDAPYLLLPCRTDLPTILEESRWVDASTVHEATHLFNMSVTSEPEWEWIDEGTAVFMERVVYGKNPEYLRFGLEWADRPDRPLDHKLGFYESFVFVRYLVHQLGAGFLSELWSGAAGTKSAIKVLDSLVPARANGLPFASASFTDLFASGYCVDSYFGWNSRDFGHDVHRRYQERTLSKSLVVTPDKREDIAGHRLEHLACRYYQVKSKDASGLRVTLKSASDKIKVEVAGSAKIGKSGKVIQLEVGKPAYFSFQGLDHIVLVAANCGLNGATWGAPLPPDNNGPNDYGEYSIEVCGT
jgi:hypothetical protein